MKNRIILFLSLLIAFSFFSVARAQTSGESSYSDEESITSFDSTITVNTDNSVDVVETITYNSGQEEWHGIYRDIYPYSSTGNKMTISDIAVVDENGNPYIFDVYNEGRNVRIKIGDPDRTFTGNKFYALRYHATRAVAQFEDFDEFYWNVTGDEWEIPIYEAGASVFLPDGAHMTQSSCYYGPHGSTSECPGAIPEEEHYNFRAPSALTPGEGLTVAVGFPKGMVSPYTTSDKIDNFFEKYLPWMIGIFLPALTLILSLLYWNKKWKDPKGRGVIVPEYDVPEKLTPLEVTGIVNEKINASNISAEIIYLATQGYVKITQIESKTLGIFKSTDYELTKLKNFDDIENDFDQKLLEGLFSSRSSVRLAELKNVFYTTANEVVSLATEALLRKGYYKNLGRIKNSAGIFIIVFMLVWASGFFDGFAGASFFQGNALPITIGIFLSMVIFGIVFRFSPAKTEKGVALKEYLLGLKDYLRIAEKDRLLFHNAPEKRPEIFEELLPFAMVLGVAHIWAKEFEGIYTTPPSWYSGSSNSAFNAVIFSHSLSSFSSYASASLSSSPSGSGGGGSSGGGGGGGGGGGW